MKHLPKAQDDSSSAMSIGAFGKLLQKRRQAEVKSQTADGGCLHSNAKAPKSQKTQPSVQPVAVLRSGSLENGGHSTELDAKHFKGAGKRSYPEIPDASNSENTHDVSEEYERHQKAAVARQEQLDSKQQAIEGLRSKLDALSNQKHELVLQLKQVLQLEENARQQQLAAAQAIQNGFYSPHATGLPSNSLQPVFYNGAAPQLAATPTMPPPHMLHPSSPHVQSAPQSPMTRPIMAPQSSPVCHPSAVYPTPGIQSLMANQASTQAANAQVGSTHHNQNPISPYSVPPPPPPPPTVAQPTPTPFPSTSTSTSIVSPALPTAAALNPKLTANGSGQPDDLEEGEREPSPPSTAPNFSPKPAHAASAVGASAQTAPPGRPTPSSSQSAPHSKTQNWGPPSIPASPLTPSMPASSHLPPHIRLPSYAPMSESPRFAPVPSPLGAPRMRAPPSIGMPISGPGRGRGVPRPGPYSGTQPPPPPQPPPSNIGFAPRRPSWNSSN